VVRLCLCLCLCRMSHVCVFIYDHDSHSSVSRYPYTYIHVCVCICVACSMSHVSSFPCSVSGLSRHSLQRTSNTLQHATQFCSIIQHTSAHLLFPMFQECSLLFSPVNQQCLCACVCVCVCVCPFVFFRCVLFGHD